MTRSLVAAAVTLAILVPGSAGADDAAVSGGCVVEIPVPGSPGGLVRKGLDVAADGTVWFTQLELNQIASYDPATAQFDFFTIPSPETGPHSVVVDQQGDVWFTEIFGHRIGVLHPATGMFEEFAPPTPESMPYGIDVAANGDVWFTEGNAAQIGVFRPSTEQFREFPVQPATEMLDNIAVDHLTGHVWVTKLDTGKLARLVPSTGAVTTYVIPGNGRPHSLDTDAASRVWFTDIGNNAIAALHPPTGTFRRFTIPTPNAVSHGIVVDFRRLLVWFTELEGDKVGVLNPVTPRFLERPVPTPESAPYFIDQAPDGEIWFTEGDAPNIGRLPCTASP